MDKIKLSICENLFTNDTLSNLVDSIGYNEKGNAERYRLIVKKGRISSAYIQNEDFHARLS